MDSVYVVYEVGGGLDSYRTCPDLRSALGMFLRLSRRQPPVPATMWRQGVRKVSFDGTSYGVGRDLVSRGLRHVSDRMILRAVGREED